MNNERVRVNEGRIVEVIYTALKAREQKQGIFENLNPPEKDYMELIKVHGKEINRPEFALNCMFFTTSMVFGDSSTAFFNRITDKDKLKKFQWIFNPEEVFKRSPSFVIENCADFFRPGGYHKIALNDWSHNHSILRENYKGDLVNYFIANENNAINIVKSLMVKVGAKAKDKPEFRRFGDKLSRLFIQWVDQYDFYNLENVNKIGIPVDFQVARIMIQTGGLDLSESIRKENIQNDILTPLFIELLADIEEVNPGIVSETLYWIGVQGCNRGRHNLCPLEDLCSSLISREPYDSKGFFNPTDNGRFNFK